MIHCALIGSIERFMSVYLEHTAGWLPLWCAPENVCILTVNDSVSPYVKKITDILDDIVLEEPVQNNPLRYSVDDASDSLGKKIRRATSLKIPVVLIVGPKDAKSDTISIRLRDQEETIQLKNLSSYIQKLQ